MSAQVGTRTTGELRREEIIEAAIVEFAATGLHGTATAAIARRVGVSQPYLFHLFGTKKDLFLAAVRRGFERIHEAFRQAAANTDRAHALEAMGTTYSSLLSDRTKLLLQLQAYAACDDPEVREVVRSGFADIARLVQRVSGASPEDARNFLAKGMLMNVAAAMDLPELDEDWARLCLGETT